MKLLLTRSSGFIGTNLAPVLAQDFELHHLKSDLLDFTAVQNEVDNINPDNPIRIRDYADLIAHKLNWQGNINWNTKLARPGEIYWLNSNHTLLTDTLGWTPKISLSQGLDKTIEIWKSKHV